MNTSSTPLPERIRPRTLDEVIGQHKLIGPSGSLRRAVESGRLPSMILWGPPGVGKTTLAFSLLGSHEAPFYSLSAVSSGVKDLRDILSRPMGIFSPIVFIDEIHRYNKSQQDALLGAVEKGQITLIGATTENPSFEVNCALLSRCQVYILEALARRTERAHPPGSEKRRKLKQRQYDSNTRPCFGFRAAMAANC